MARRLRRREPVDLDEVEDLLQGAHRQDIAEVVRKCGRHALRQAFDGHLDDKDWDYFTHTLLQLEGVWTCAEIKILRRAWAKSSRRPSRHRRDACSMAWRCRFLTARRSQHGSVIAEK